MRLTAVGEIGSEETVGETEICGIRIGQTGVGETGIGETGIGEFVCRRSYSNKVVYWYVLKGPFVVQSDLTSN